MSKDHGASVTSRKEAEGWLENVTAALTESGVPGKQRPVTSAIVAVGYALLAVTVARLPVPMWLPVWQQDQPLALRSLDLAWDLIGQESTDPLHVGYARDMITAWATAYELGINATGSGPAPWRLRGMAAALATCRERAAQVNRHLDWLARERRRIAREEARRRREGS